MLEAVDLGTGIVAGFDGDDAGLDAVVAEPLGDAHQAAAGAVAGDEGVDLAVELLGDLATGAVVVGGDVVGVLVLVDVEVLVGLGGDQFLGGVDVGVGVVLGGEDEVGAPEAEHAAALDGLVLEHEELELVALDGGDHAEGDAGVAAGGLDDGHAWA